MTMGGEKTGRSRSLYLYSENRIWCFTFHLAGKGITPRHPNTSWEGISGGIWMCKDCQSFKRLQQAFSGFPCWSFHSVQEFTNYPWILADFLLVFIHPIQRLPKSVLDTKLSKTRLPEKKTCLFLPKKNHEKEKQFTQSNPWLLRHVFPVVVCEAWFQILAGESHVADLAAAPGCRDPQGGSRGWVMSDEWVYDITMKKIHQVYEGITRWWFQILFIFTPIWGRFPFWLIFLRWVETTKQIRIYFGLWTPLFSQDAQKNAPNAAGFFGRFWSGWNPGNPKRLKPEPLPRERREIWEQLKGPNRG